MTSSLITPVIICGGTGTRLWPVSRERPEAIRPARRRPLDVPEVLERVADPEIFERPIVITNVEFRFTVAEQTLRAGASADIVLEPVGRDSGPAIVAAAELATARRNPDAGPGGGPHCRDTDGFPRACQKR